jgi:hypothetical protein
MTTARYYRFNLAVQAIEGLLLAFVVARQRRELVDSCEGRFRGRGDCLVT